jgi:hypothetical protein
MIYWPSKLFIFYISATAVKYLALYMPQILSSIVLQPAVDTELLNGIQA